MSNIDWLTIQSHLQNDTLRDHFASMFTASSAVEAYVQYCQYFLSKFSQSSSDLPELSISLPVLRIFLLSVPNYVFRALSCKPDLIEWFKQVVSSGSLHSIGNSLSILSILAKNLQSVDDLLPHIATCFQMTVKRVADCTKSWAPEHALHVLIVVHQLEDLLNIIGGNPALPTHIICQSVGDSASLIDFLSSENCKSVPNCGKFIVDTMKLCAMILEVWVTHHRNIESVTLTVWSESAITILQNVFTLTIEGDVTHDCFHTALYGASEMLFIVSHSQLQDNAEAFEVRRNVLKQCCGYLADADSQLTSVLQCSKVEALVGYLSSFFETESQQLQEALSKDMLPVVPSVVECIVSLQVKMKEKLTTASKPTTTTRELKGLYSDIRKGSIATMTAVLNCCPQWIVDYQSAYWDLCLKSLMTPVLFSAGYRALSQDDAFLVRLLQYLHTALLAVPRYSVSAADDIIQTLQDLIDSGHCYQLYSNSTSYDILAALLSTYSLSPKPASTDSNSVEAKLNWQISVVVTVNALLQMCKTQEGTHILTEEFFSTYFNKFVSEFIEQTSVADDGGYLVGASPKNKGGKAADLKVELLHSTTLLLMSLAEVCSAGVVNHGGEGVVRSHLLKLMVHLMSINSRETIFEEDAAQLSGEFDLLTKVVILLTGDANGSSKEQQHVILIAIISLCNVVCVKNGQETEADLSLCSQALLSGQQGGAASAVAVLFDQLKCTYASSLSGQAQTLQADSDVTYKCVREAILNLTHHCTTLVAAERKQEVDDLLHSVYESLPLEVDQLPALDAAGGQQREAFKLSIRKSFTYDILCCVKAILM